MGVHDEYVSQGLGTRLLSSLGTGGYPFMIAEGVWAVVALSKWANYIDRPT